MRHHLLGEFELNGIPPAPRGVPQLEVTFEIDANGILQVSAEDKGSGRAEKITVAAERGRLSEADIARMVREAEEFAEQDRKTKERVDGRNGLESYLYGLKNAVADGLAGKLSDEDQEELEAAANDALGWLDAHPEADSEAYDAKRKEVEKIAKPIMEGAYDVGSGADGDEEDGFRDDEL